MANEPTVKRARLPRGYSLVLKGNVYITGNCRKQTQAASQPVYLVVNAKEKQIGIAVPTAIYEEVKQKEIETRTARATVVDRRDKAIKNDFEQVLRREFPGLPATDLRRILNKALEKGAGKVGRTGQLTERQKAQLAVRAHIRHCHTSYDEILRGAVRKGSRSKNLARKTVQRQVDELAASWAQGRPGQLPSPAKTSTVASSLASLPPARSTRIGESKAGPAPPVGAKLARMKRSVTPLTMASSTGSPAWSDAALSCSLQDLEIPEQEIIDLTMDDDDAPGRGVSSRP